MVSAMGPPGGGRETWMARSSVLFFDFRAFVFWKRLRPSLWFRALGIIGHVVLQKVFMPSLVMRALGIIGLLYFRGGFGLRAVGIAEHLYCRRVSKLGLLKL